MILITISILAILAVFFHNKRLKYGFCDFIIANVGICANAVPLSINIFFDIVFSSILGIVLAFILYYKIAILTPITRNYIEISRNVPFLI